MILCIYIPFKQTKYCFFLFIKRFFLKNGKNKMLKSRPYILRFWGNTITFLRLLACWWWLMNYKASVKNTSKFRPVYNSALRFMFISHHHLFSWSNQWSYDEFPDEEETFHNYKSYEELKRCIHFVSFSINSFRFQVSFVFYADMFEQFLSSFSHDILDFIFSVLELTAFVLGGY